MNDEVSQFTFKANAERPDFWYGNAEAFEHASSELEIIQTDRQLHPPPGPPPQLGGTITFLQGLAIENQVKAILIALCPCRFVVEEGLTNEFTTHNLQELIRIANSYKSNLIPKKKGRGRLIAKLTVAVEWGRYGLPKTVSDFQKTIKQGYFPLITDKGGQPLTKDEKKAYRVLYEDLRKAVDSLGKPPQ